MIPIGINIGDTVDVFFDYVDCEIACDVLYKPQATGDSWVLRRDDGKTILCIQHFAKMVRHN